MSDTISVIDNKIINDVLKEYTVHKINKASIFDEIKNVFNDNTFLLVIGLSVFAGLAYNKYYSSLSSSDK